MKDIKLVALDMDGTLLNSQKKLPPDFITWVKSHKDIKTVISSGRQYYTLLADFEEVKDDIIFSAENGGLVFNKGKCIFQNTMDREKAFEMMKHFSKFPNLAVLLCCVNSAYMLNTKGDAVEEAKRYYKHLTILKHLKECPEIDSIVKMAFYDTNHNSAETFKTFKNYIPEGLKGVVSGTSWMDVANESVNKGTGIQKIQQILHIDRSESMAFGDYMNDYEMLQSVEESYAMANACYEIKVLAKHQTSSNDEDGVMRILRKL